MANILARELPHCISLIDSDTVSSRLITAGLELANMDADDRDSPAYKDAFRDPVYQTMFDLPDNLHASNISGAAVVLCGPFTRECKDVNFPAWLHERLGGGDLRIEMHYVSCPNDNLRRERMTRRAAARDQQVGK